MTSKDAALLSLTHKLGSKQNTLVPGHEVPAFTAGMDPNKWAAQVKAIGMARLSPAGSEASLYQWNPDYGIGGLPGYSGLDSKTLALKSPQDQANAVAKLSEAMSLGSEPGANPFAEGKWLFGDTMGGLQQAFLSSAAQDEASQQSARNFALARQQAINEARLKDEASARQRDLDTYTVQKDRENLQLSIMDRLDRAAQTDFANRFALSKLTGEQINTDTVAGAGRTAAKDYVTAATQLGTAQEAWNQRVLQLAEQFNIDNPGVQAGVVTEMGADNVVRLKPEKMTGAKFNALTAGLASSPEAAGLQAAHDALTKAQIANQSIQYTPRVTVPGTPLPSTMSPQLMALLQRYGGLGASGVPLSTPRSPAVSLLPVRRPVAAPAPVAPAPVIAPAPITRDSVQPILDLINRVSQVPSGGGEPWTGWSIPSESDLFNPTLTPSPGYAPPPISYSGPAVPSGLSPNNIYVQAQAIRNNRGMTLEQKRAALIALGFPQ